MPLGFLPEKPKQRAADRQQPKPPIRIVIDLRVMASLALFTVVVFIFKGVLW